MSQTYMFVEYHDPAGKELSCQQIVALFRGPFRVNLGLGSPMENHCPRNKGAQLKGFLVSRQVFDFWNNANHWKTIQQHTGMDIVAVYSVTQHYLDWGTYRAIAKNLGNMLQTLVLFLLLGWNLYLLDWLYVKCWQDQEVSFQVLDAQRIEYRIVPAPFLVWTGLRRPYVVVKDKLP